MVRFLFEDPAAPRAEDLIPKKADAATTLAAMRRLEDALLEIAAAGPEQSEARLREIAEEQGMKLGDMLMPLRVAVTGSKVSPPLVESIRVMGVEAARRRAAAAIAVLEASTTARS